MNMVIWWHTSYWYLCACTTLLVHRFLIMPWIVLAFCTCAVLPHENLLLSLKPHTNHCSHFVRQWINRSNGGSNHTIYTKQPLPRQILTSSPPRKNIPLTILVLLLRRGSIKSTLIHLLLQLAFLQTFCASSVQYFKICVLFLLHGTWRSGFWGPPDATLGVLWRGVHVRPFSVCFSQTGTSLIVSHKTAVLTALRTFAISWLLLISLPTG